MPKRPSVLESKSKIFALRIIRLFSYLKKRKETVIGKQLLRSGTSIGANVVEANYAQSRDDFASKMGIAVKEAAETRYWLELLIEGGILEESDAYSSLHQECEELIKMLVSSIKTVKTR